MKVRFIAFIGLAFSLLGAAAARGEGRVGDRPSAAESALVGGAVACDEFDGQAGLRLVIGGFGFDGSYNDIPGSGGVIGIPGTDFEIYGVAPGACADALTALRAKLPAPLCATGPAAFGTDFRFTCSGPAHRVIAAVGGLAKALVALP